MFGSVNITLIFSYEKTDDIMKITKSLEESGLFIQDVSEIIKNEAKKTKARVSTNVIRHFRYYFIRKSINRSSQN